MTNKSALPTTLEWDDVDKRAVDTARVLAMDAVQKVGNGHPGTAMSLAPAAYLLFQKVMRHDPADPEWIARDRFVLSCGTLQHHPLHPALPRRLRPRARRPQGAAHVGLEDPRPPRARPHRRRRGDHRARWARASATRSAWPSRAGACTACSTRTPRPARASSTTRSTSLASDGDLQEGVSSEASSIAGTQKLGNLTVIYDRNRISIEGDTDIAFTEDVAARYEAYGWHVQTVDWTNGGTDYVEDVPALYSAIRKARGVGDKPSLIVLDTVIAWPAPNAQGTEAAHGSALGADEVAATKKILGFDPDQTFEVPPGVLEHTRGAARARLRMGRGVGRGVRRLGRRRTRSPPSCCTGSSAGRCPPASPTRCRPSPPTPRASPPGPPPAR